MHSHLAPYGAVPNERQMQQYEIGKKAFFHVGLNTFYDREWGDGTEDPARLAFTDCDVDSWIRCAKDAGCGLAILVCKHHDGFCVWQTQTTEHSIKHSPYGGGRGDLVREFADACQRHGVKMGIYLSLWDRHVPFYGKPAYNDYYVAQLTELLTRYGEIYEVWWDGAGSASGNLDTARFAKLVRTLQPHAAIFGALGAADHVDLRWCGNEAGKVADVHFASIDREMIRAEDNRVLNRGQQGACAYVPAEVDTSIRPGWFYHPSQDGMVKSVEELNRLWFCSVGRNAHLLLNFPVDTRGRIHDTDRHNAAESHRQITDMLSVDYLAGASVAGESCDAAHTASQALCEHDGFFVAATDTCVLTVTLPEACEVNTLLLGEEITLGERIHTVRLYRLTDGGEQLLAEAPSVGYLRAIPFAACTVKALRLELVGAAAPTLRRLSLHRFAGSTVDPARARGENLMARPEAHAEISDDRRSAILAFGGIYPFRKVTCLVGGMGKLYLSVFDGFAFKRVFEGFALSEEAEIFLPEEIDDAYQIRIETEQPLDADPKFYVG